MSEIRDQQTFVQITNILDHTITIPQKTTVAVFRILTPNQVKKIQPMTNEKLRILRPSRQRDQSVVPGP